jgi:hypothetical protein
VDAIYNYAGLAWRTEPSYVLTEHKITDEISNIFNAYWALALVKELNKPDGKVLITGDFRDSKDFKYLTYEEYVKEVLLCPEPKEEEEEHTTVMSILCGE